MAGYGDSISAAGTYPSGKTYAAQAARGLRHSGYDYINSN